MPRGIARLNWKNVDGTGLESVIIHKNADLLSGKKWIKVCVYDSLIPGTKLETVMAWMEISALPEEKVLVCKQSREPDLAKGGCIRICIAEADDKKEDPVWIDLDIPPLIVSTSAYPTWFKWVAWIFITLFVVGVLYLLYSVRGQ
ncbi:MAG: hypothetical protein G01um101418_817 [Parcubacteria group bacterium Gr01-1014_18]|nr:MAG: hypothetical protein Greene041636_803 [Parcubacteria group bacterium Greene0416_36]TSC80014.1 MAG: hypothetical protein G01um101418_817 [Parcubacteria group bacterium Gr01-1014_18]TSC98118.1 MAG: hypothetical protein Greene101420_889 [Parcubacteria group bacterium Greene1014_20]